MEISKAEKDYIDMLAEIDNMGAKEWGIETTYRPDDMKVVVDKMGLDAYIKNTLEDNENTIRMVYEGRKDKSEDDSVQTNYINPKLNIVMVKQLINKCKCGTPQMQKLCHADENNLEPFEVWMAYCYKCGVLFITLKR